MPLKNSSMPWLLLDLTTWMPCCSAFQHISSESYSSYKTMLPVLSCAWEREIISHPFSSICTGFLWSAESSTRYYCWYSSASMGRPQPILQTSSVHTHHHALCALETSTFWRCPQPRESTETEPLLCVDPGCGMTSLSISESARQLLPSKLPSKPSSSKLAMSCINLILYDLLIRDYLMILQIVQSNCKVHWALWKMCYIKPDYYYYYYYNTEWQAFSSQTA